MTTLTPDDRQRLHRLARRCDIPGIVSFCQRAGIPRELTRQFVIETVATMFLEQWRVEVQR